MRCFFGVGPGVVVGDGVAVGAGVGVEDGVGVGVGVGEVDWTFTMTASYATACVESSALNKKV